LRITVDGIRIEINTSRFIDKSKWLSEGSKMKGNSEEARSINSYLDVLKNKIYETEKNIANNNSTIKYIRNFGKVVRLCHANY